MVAHDSDDVTALGDFFQIRSPNSFRLLLILVDMPDK
jgi:hypothetical protein